MDYPACAQSVTNDVTGALTLDLLAFLNDGKAVFIGVTLQSSICPTRSDDPHGDLLTEPIRSRQQSQIQHVPRVRTSPAPEGHMLRSRQSLRAASARSSTGPLPAHSLDPLDTPELHRNATYETADACGPATWSSYRIHDSPSSNQASSSSIDASGRSQQMSLPNKCSSQKINSKGRDKPDKNCTFVS